jgi:hypothetical protein
MAQDGTKFLAVFGKALFLYQKGVSYLMTVICIKADRCNHSPACQHGKPHEPQVNCEATLCGFGGEVKCVVPVTQESREMLADNVDAITNEVDNDWQDNEVHHEA